MVFFRCLLTNLGGKFLNSSSFVGHIRHNKFISYHKFVVEDEIRGNINDGTELVPLLKLPSPLGYDSFESLHFASFDFHKSSAEESGMGNDVGAAKSEGKSDDWTAASGKNAERAVGCRGDSCFEVNFDGN